jgi:hypothetical protein
LSVKQTSGFQSISSIPKSAHEFCNDADCGRSP